MIEREVLLLLVVTREKVKTVDSRYRQRKGERDSRTLARVGLAYNLKSPLYAPPHLNAHLSSFPQPASLLFISAASPTLKPSRSIMGSYGEEIVLQEEEITVLVTGFGVSISTPRVACRRITVSMCLPLILEVCAH